MSNIDKNIVILKELIKNANIEDADMNECFDGEHIIAIENVLSELEKEIEGRDMLAKLNQEILLELETYKKIAYKLAGFIEKRKIMKKTAPIEKYRVGICAPMRIVTATSQDIIDWARKKVEKDE